jgi:hypothetical protein
MPDMVVDVEPRHAALAPAEADVAAADLQRRRAADKGFMMPVGCLGVLYRFMHRPPGLHPRLLFAGEDTRRSHQPRRTSPQRISSGAAPPERASDSHAQPFTRALGP